MRPFDLRLIDRCAPGAPYHARYADVGTDEDELWLGLYFRRDYWEVTAILAGEARQFLQGRDGRIHSEPLLPGRMFMWRPQDLNKIVAVEPHGVRFVQVCFPTAEWLTFASVMGFDPARLTAMEPPAILFDVDDPAVAGAFDAAVRALEGEATMVDLARFWMEIAPRMLPVSRRSHAGLSGPQWLIAGVDAMRDEDNLRGGLPRFLEIVHISSRQLARATQRYYGMTPTNLVADLRLRRAARLLTTTSDSIGMIARRVGFDDAAYFSGRFRRATSVSPSEYRERARG